MKIKKYTELNRKTVDEFRQAEKFPVVVVLDNVRSMHNVGSVFRTADAFLVSGMWLCGYTPRPPHRDIQKTALGATETVKWQYAAKTADALTVLKGEGYRIFAVEQVEKSVSLQDFSFDSQEKVAVIFGNEVTGVDAEVLALCDGFVEIPQYGMKHSLNISVAAGIILWELCGRRSK
ncbi:MAG: TrmH family RNA methyltransferase [Chitinophagaceae bacterium]|nr:MAG: TrmH family RNA methyltransferase [Chitinophagaceae bacterium]